MSNRIVECVPNFSEGREAGTVRALIDAVRAVPGVAVLDHTMDPDHNRAVLTFAGAPEPVAEAAFQAVQAAAAHIDLRKHQGGHPRVGILRFETTRGDRLFVSLLGSGFINLAWLGLVGPELWWSLALSVVYAICVFRFV